MVTMAIKDCLKIYSEIEIELLLEHVLRKPKEFIFLHPEFKLTMRQLNNLTQLAKRRLKGEPMAYILGYKDFYGLRFKVNKSVLVPRPETELLVNHIVRACREQVFSTRFVRSKNIKMLDLGTGSGCIAISLAKKFKDLKIENFKIIASDISKQALAVAKQNAKDILGFKYFNTLKYESI